MEGHLDIERTQSADLPRSKTSLRMNYEAQIEVLKRQIGDLEEIRETLGLSARRICQLLLVDPSAWSRWTKKGDRPPPHIYRALQWYLMLQEKWPGISPNLFLGGLQTPKDQEILQKIDRNRMHFEACMELEQKNWQIQMTELQMRMRKLTIFCAISWGLLISCGIGYAIFR